MIGKAKKKHNTFFIAFKAGLVICFLCFFSALKSWGNSPFVSIEPKDSINTAHAIDTLEARGNDYAYFDRFFFKKDNSLAYPPSRLDYLIAQHYDPTIYDMIIDANISSGCLCAGEPLLLTAMGMAGPLEVSPQNSAWYYLIPNSTSPYTRKSIPSAEMSAAEAVDPYVRAIVPDVPMLRDLVLNQASKNAGHFLVLPHGPLTQSTPDPKMLQSFTQSLLNMIKLGGYMTGQEFYTNLVVNAGQGLLKVKSILQKWNVMPSDDVLTKAFSNTITSGTDAPDAFSVPITIEGDIPKSGGGTVLAETTTPYSRPIYTRPPKAIVDIDCNNCFKGIKAGTTAKSSIYAANGSWVEFKPNSVHNEDPRIHYSWYGLPSLKAFGLGRALSGIMDPKQPSRITMNSSIMQSGLYGLMKYRGPIPPIGCASVSNWTELFVGCSDDPDDREGLIKLEGDNDFAEHYWYDLSGKAKRAEPYEPVICEGSDAKIVSGGRYSTQQCEYTYEWYGPGLVLTPGTTDEYIMTPNVLLGGLTKVTLTQDGIPTARMEPIETGETLIVKNMKPEMSGVYTRIASRTGKGMSWNIAGLGCKECFRIAQITITVKPSLPKLIANSPICEDEELVIAISPTTNDETLYQWAHESNPSKWSAWSDVKQVRLPHIKMQASGIYLVRAKDKKSGCESINPATITVEVKEKIPINLSISKNTVYAGRQSILTASLSGTNTAPAEGITITLSDVGGNATRGTHYELLPPNIYIPANRNSISTTIITKWTKPATGELAKTVIVTGSVTNSTSSSSKTCYVIPAAVTLTINPLFKPEITNGPISPICSGDAVDIALSSTLAGTTYQWIASNETGNVSGFASAGSSPIINEQLTNNNHSLSGTVVYTITPQVEDPENPSLHIHGEPKSLTVTVIPISKKVIVNMKHTSIDELSFDWLPENPLNNNTTYRWYTHADKTGGTIKEGKGISGTYSISTTTPNTYVYYISTEEDGYCENEPTEIALTAKHHINLTFDKPQVQQGEKAILTASLSGTLVAPVGGITITLSKNGSSAQMGINYDAFSPTIYIPAGSSAMSITINTKGTYTMESDKILLVQGHATSYIINEPAALTITRDINNNSITLVFGALTIAGKKVAKLIASLPPGISAGHQITINLQRAPSSTAAANKDYTHLRTSITIGKGESSVTIDAFTAQDNCIIDGSTILTLTGIAPQGYTIQNPNPTITILDKTGDDRKNRKIILSFDDPEVRGGQIDKLNICLQGCVVSTKPIHIKLHKRKVAFPDQPAIGDIDYKKFSWDVTIDPFTQCTSIPIQTLVNNNADIRTLWMTGKAAGYDIDPSKVNIITPKILIPNVFTPSAATHRTWEIHNLDLYESCTVLVFNRWGRIVFKSIGYPEQGGWDGTFRDQPLPTGTYYYKIDLKDGSPLLQGYVAIIR